MTTRWPLLICLGQPVCAALVSLLILFCRIGASFRPTTGQTLVFVLAGAVPIWIVAAVATAWNNKAEEAVMRRSLLVATVVVTAFVIYSTVSAEYAVATLRPGFSTVGCDLVVLPVVSLCVGVMVYFFARAIIREHMRRSTGDAGRQNADGS